MADNTTIRIKTKIDAGDSNSQLLLLENRIVKTADKITALKDKMNQLKDSKPPTAEYAALQAELDKTETSMGKLIDRQIKMQETGKAKGSAWKNLQYDIRQAEEKAQILEESMKRLEESGKAFSLGTDSAEFEKLSKDLRSAESEMDALVQKHGELIQKQSQVGTSGAEAFSIIASGAKKVSGFIDKILNRLKRLVSFLLNQFKKAIGVFKDLNKSVDESSKSLSFFTSQMRRFVFNLLILNQLRRAFTSFTKAITEGFKNLALYSADFNTQMSQAVSATETLKHQLAAASMPIAQMLLPYMTSFLDVIIKCIEAVSHLFAALTGRSTYTRAIRQNIDYADSLEKIGAAAKGVEGSLHSLDQINRMPSDVSSGGVGTIGNLFEEVEIDSQFKNMADRIKNFFSGLFAPFKTAWDRQGQFVMDSWKYALNEIKALVKDIGRDFMAVWNQEATVKIFENLLIIIVNIGLIVGNLASQFKDAWNENEVGKLILEAIRDIIGVIVEGVKEIVILMAEWADNLNFYPILESILKIFEALKPVAKAFMGVLKDIWTEFASPILKWFIEVAGPRLIDIFTEFVNSIDWEWVRQQLKRVWQALEPFTKAVGEGLLMFIEELSKLLANWINNGGFESFIDWLVNTLDSVTADDVYNALMQIYKGIKTLREMAKEFWDNHLKEWLAGLWEYLQSKTLSEHLDDLGKVIKWITGIKIAGWVAEFALGVGVFAIGLKKIVGLFTGAGGVATAAGTAGVALTGFKLIAIKAIGGLAAAFAGWKFGEWIDKKFLEPLWKGENAFTGAIDKKIALWTGFDKKSAGSMTIFDAVMGHISEGKSYEGDWAKRFKDDWQFTDDQIAEIQAAMDAKAHELNKTGTTIGTEFNAGVSSQLPQSVTVGENLVEGTGQGVEKKSSWLAGIFRDLGKSAIMGTFASTLGIHSPSTIFEGYGKNIMTGLQSGINGMRNSVSTTITNVGETVKKAFSKVLQIFSPSRIFEKYGINTVEGFNIGIEGMRKTTERLMGNFADNLCMDVDLSPVMGGVGNSQISSALNASRRAESQPQMPSMSASGNASQKITVEVVGKLDRWTLFKAIKEVDLSNLARA